jgi:two-component system CheB/CheR fusion protein
MSTETMTNDTTAPLRVLVAEDEPTNLMVTTRFLKVLGHESETASSGAEALEKLGAGPFDLVLMDIEMPEMSGLDATRAIRAGQVPGLDPDIPVLALSAWGREQQHATRRAGMNGLVAKPLEMDELVRALQPYVDDKN